MGRRGKWGNVVGEVVSDGILGARQVVVVVVVREFEVVD